MSRGVQDLLRSDCKAEVVVIGGGIAGVSTALALTRMGIQTTICEKGDIGREQSGRNWGWCSTIGRDRRELELRMLSLRLWGEMNALVEGETGFRRSGILNLAKSLAHLDELHDSTSDLRNAGIDVRVLSGPECQLHVPGAGKAWPGGLLAASDGRAEPTLAAAAIARGAETIGAKILTHCPVERIETKAGRVCGVVTAKGRIDCSAVIIAAGAFSTKLCRQLGVRFPQVIVNESVMRTAAVDRGPSITLRDGGFSDGGFSLRKRLDGGYTIGGGGKILAELTPDSFRFLLDFAPLLKANWQTIRIKPTKHSAAEWRNVLRRAGTTDMLDPAPDTALLARVHASLVTAFPAFAGVPIVERWAGAIDVTPDAMPVISPLPMKGAFLIAGFSGHGFGMGPGAGSLMASLVAGGRPPADPSPFHIDRLSRVDPDSIGPL